MPSAAWRTVPRPHVLNTASSDPRRIAENDLWHALEERREAIRAAHLTFSERQHHQLREAHEAGRLIDTLNAAMERRATATTADPYYLRPMAEAIKAGLDPWEAVLIRRASHGHLMSHVVLGGARSARSRTLSPISHFYSDRSVTGCCCPSMQLGGTSGYGYGPVS